MESDSEHDRWFGSVLEYRRQLGDFADATDPSWE
jgi:hypothetical protein